ncbi:Altered inheritance of mitochondria protein 1 [Rhizopus azygosporus]|uniref:Altered inheritance of mitochondria protein 1 n=1 Tax=Rhizopus azygosporus TaxID=86630 RepID=A0A367J7Z0_RHIAZ|nr:Altered inheritance of mitochondria protein 1 [Rhizopus azygosporus]
MFLKDKAFYIVSKKTGLVLSTNGYTEEGSKITVQNKVSYCYQTGEEHELWQFESGFLINKSSSLVLDIIGGDLRVGQKVNLWGRKKTMAHNQRWGIRDGYIYALADPRLVLDIEGDCEDEGTHIVTNSRRVENHDLQQWTLIPFTEEE